MCTNRTLYMVGNVTEVVPQTRKRGEGQMDFRQVSFATDCLKMLANRREMPIVLLAQKMTEKGVFPKFYELLNAQPAYSKVQVVNRLQKLV